MAQICKEEEELVKREVKWTKALLYVCLAFVCFNAYKFIFAFCTSWVRVRRSENLGILAFHSSMLGFVFILIIATWWFRTEILRRKMMSRGLLNAFGDPESFELERVVIGTNLHKEATNDVTKLTFVAFASVNVLPFILELLFHISQTLGYLMVMYNAISSSIMMFLFGLSFSMNLNVLRSAQEKQRKLAQ